MRDPANLTMQATIQQISQINFNPNGPYELYQQQQQQTVSYRIIVPSNTNTTSSTTSPIPATIPNGHSSSNQQSRNLVEVAMDPALRPNFASMTDDYNLLENLLIYSKYCEKFNVPVIQMAQTLTRAIGIQNKGKYNVMVYDYVNAIPEYPPTRNGRMESFDNTSFCNMICYQGVLFGVLVFPSTETVTFYFDGFSTFGPEVQQLIFTFGNKGLTYSQEKKALAFHFRPTPVSQQPVSTAAQLQHANVSQSQPATSSQSQQQQQPFLLTATLQQRNIQQEPLVTVQIQQGSPREMPNQQQGNQHPEYIQLE